MANLDGVQIRTLLSTLVAVSLTALLGGLASRPAQSSWYQQLKKPPYQPPRQAFPIVWPILYADIAGVSAAALDELEGRERRAYIAALVTNLILNGSWSWLFFNRRRLGTSALAAGALTVSSADLTRRAAAVRGPKATPLGLYPLWCALATVLSTHIWALNRR